MAADAPTLQNISGRRFASFLEVITLIIVALVIAFVYSWQIALVALAFFPILILVGAFEVNRTLTSITLDSLDRLYSLMIYFLLIDDAVH